MQFLGVLFRYPHLGKGAGGSKASYDREIEGMRIAFFQQSSLAEISTEFGKACEGAFRLMLIGQKILRCALQPFDVSCDVTQAAAVSNAGSSRNPVIQF